MNDSKNKVQSIAKKTLLSAMAAGLVATPLIAGNIDSAEAAPANKSVSQEQMESDITTIFNDINDYRESLGLKRLKYSSSISTIAQKEATRAATSGDLSHSLDFLTNPAAGQWKSAGEITALSGKTDAHRFLKWWKNSSAHNDIMTRNDIDVMGIGLHAVTDSKGYFKYVATVDFYGYGSNYQQVDMVDSPGQKTVTTPTAPVEAPQPVINETPTPSDESTVIQGDNNDETTTTTNNNPVEVVASPDNSLPPLTGVDEAKSPDIVDNLVVDDTNKTTTPNEQGSSEEPELPTIDEATPTPEEIPNVVDNSDTVSSTESPVNSDGVEPPTQTEPSTNNQVDDTTNVIVEETSVGDDTVSYEQDETTVAPYRENPYVPKGSSKEFLTPERLAEIQADPNVYTPQESTIANSKPQPAWVDSVDVTGAIGDFYHQDGAGNKYGKPLSAQIDGLYANGSTQSFENNYSILHNEATGAHAIKWDSPIGQYFQNNGSEEGVGYPFSNEVNRQDSSYQKFRDPITKVEKTVFYTEATGAHSVNHSTKVGENWRKYGGEFAVGRPTSELIERLDGVSYQQFQAPDGSRNIIFSSESTGTYLITESSPIGQAWLEAGGEYNWGLPVTNMFRAHDGTLHQRFSNGVEVSYSTEQGVTIVS